MTARQPLSNPRQLLSWSHPSTARGSHRKCQHQITQARHSAAQGQPQLHNKSEASTATQDSVSKENKKIAYAPVCSQMKKTHKQLSEKPTCGFFSASVFINTLAHSEGSMSPSASAKPLTSILSTWPLSRFHNSINPKAHTLGPFCSKGPPRWHTGLQCICLLRETYIQTQSKTHSQSRLHLISFPHTTLFHFLVF